MGFVGRHRDFRPVQALGMEPWDMQRHNGCAGGGLGVGGVAGEVSAWAESSAIFARACVYVWGGVGWGGVGVGGMGGPCVP
jgi:hypothetical protein